jgi:fused-like protein
MERYELLERIGVGSFGTVHRGRRRFTGQFCALKLISKERKEEKELAALRSEVAILTRLSHPHVIRLLDYFENENELVLVTELACGELFEVLCSDGRLAPAAVASVARGLTSALAYLHEQHVMHRDLKPQNCLIAANGAIKLADFGFARELQSHAAQLTSVRGTPLYMAPELFQQAHYTAAADVWSLGVLLFELAAGRPPFFADTLPELMQAIVQDTPVPFPLDMQPQLADFLALCLQRDPGQRAAWEALLQHPYLTG